jgi:hypothetical protein
MFTYSLNRNYFNNFYRINFSNQNKLSKIITNAVSKTFLV